MIPEEVKEAFKKYKECLETFKEMGVKRVGSFLEGKKVIVFFDAKLPLYKEPILRETFHKFMSSLEVIYACRFLKDGKYQKIVKIEVIFEEGRTEQYITFDYDTDLNGDKNVA